jgi:hypothetical protein
LHGTPRAGYAYIDLNVAGSERQFRVSGNRRRQFERGEKMKDVKNMLRIMGIILLGMFVLVVGIPLVLTAAGIVLSGVGAIIGIAVLLIKLAVVVAIGYLVLVGIRAALR